MSASSRIPGFYRMAIADRRRRLAAARPLDDETLAALDDGGLDIHTADHMIENVVGTFALPLGIGLNFQVDGADYLIPMVIEEPSVVAAASNAAKMVRAGGGFRTRVAPPVMIGQIQLLEVPAPDDAASAIEAEREALIARARALAPRLVDRGGGPRRLEVRVLSRPGDPDGGVVVVHVHVDCRDAMGANLVNTIAEGLSGELAQISGGVAGLRILSNLADQRVVEVTARVPDSALVAPPGRADTDPGAGVNAMPGTPGADRDPGEAARVRQAIASASRFAELDPYRAATHNKGIMNGIDAVLLATGNDWRGVEAGAHAYACRDGRYQPLATWRDEDGALVGRLEMPMAVGTVGGALHVHRGATLALALLAVDSASELAGVIAAVGLASNLAALRALATDGIQRGHMSLHARVIARAAGADAGEIERVAAEIAAAGDVKPERARQILLRLRAAGRPRGSADARRTPARPGKLPGPLPGDDRPEDCEDLS